MNPSVYSEIFNLKNWLTLIVILSSHNLYCQSDQSILIDYHDANYIKQELNGFDLNDKEIKNGKIFVYYDYECGERDTLLKANIENGKREGIWEYYDIDVFPCSEWDYMYEKRFYKKGILQKLRTFQVSDREIFYKPNTKKPNDKRVVSVIFRNDDGVITRIDSIKNKIYHTTEFDSNGNIKSESEWNHEFDKKIEFHTNGQKSKEYKLITLKNEEEVLDGKYKEWNEQGELIKELDYKKGKPKRKKKTMLPVRRRLSK